MSNGSEKTLGRKTFDFAHEEKGQLIGWEVWLSGRAQAAAQQALKALENRGIRELRVVCRDVGSEKQLRKALKTADPEGTCTDRITTWVLSDFA